MFSSLSFPNYRIYIAGHFISMVGVWMQGVGLSWLVWRLTGSGDWLGIVGFASSVMTLVLGLVGGAVVDKFYRRDLIVFTQILSMLQASILAVLVITGIITPWMIVVLVLFLGAVFAFDFPARQSFITDIVGKEYVDNAVALGSALVHAARVVGPAAAGLIIAYSGEGLCFIINAVTFIALIAAVLLIDKSRLNFQPTHSLPMCKAIREGVKAAWHIPGLKRPLVLLAMISFFGMPYYILIPIFVGDIYGGGSKMYGFLMAASAAGSLLGGLIMAKMSGQGRLYGNIGIASIGFAISLMTFAWLGSFQMGLVVMVFMGLFTLITLASINAWLQRESPDHLRGRILSIFTMMFFGVTPFGSLIAGASAERFGAPITVAAGGAVCLISAILFFAGKIPLKQGVLQH